MRTRLLRISCFAAGVALHQQCEKHFAPLTEEKSHAVFKEQRRKILTGKYARVVLHLGNLKRNSYQIIRDDCTWTPADELARELTREHTSFPDFETLLDAPNYFPSLNVSNPGRLQLADLYDAAQAARKDKRRVFRWHAAPTSTLGRRRREETLTSPLPA